MFSNSRTHFSVSGRGFGGGKESAQKIVFASAIYTVCQCSGECNICTAGKDFTATNPALPSTAEYCESCND